MNDKAWCCKQLGSPCTAPIYWCCKPVSTNILVLQTFKKSANIVAPIYWCYDVRSTNILVLRVLAAPIGGYTQAFYNLQIFADFLNVCSTNILVLTGLQHQYIGAVQGEPIVCSTTPICSNDAYSICWSKQKRK